MIKKLVSPKKKKKFVIECDWWRKNSRLIQKLTKMSYDKNCEFVYDT